MIVDSFTFFNELDLLEFRLKLLYDFVDKFIIVEGDKTFSGKDKPFYFETARSRFDWASDKILYHQAALSADGLSLDTKPGDYDPASSYFNLEYQQRNAIADACGLLRDDCILLISDVDEIPSREILAALRAVEGRPWNPFACDQKLFYYTLDYQLALPWRGTVATTVGEMRMHTPQSIRNIRNLLPYAPNGGWHLSYFGTTDVIAHKIDSFAHQEFNQEQFKNPSHLQSCIKNGTDLFGRDIPITKHAKGMFPEYFLSLTAANEPFFFCA